VSASARSVRSTATGRELLPTGRADALTGDVKTVRRAFGTAVERWAGVGPYYAMFPIEFAFEVVARYSANGSGVLDPFAGRASSIYAAAALGRRGLGIEISPVGWLYGSVKLKPATERHVLARLDQIAEIARQDATVAAEAAALPAFFVSAYAPRVVRFLIAARTTLAWRTSVVDRTLMAFILIYLHGKRTAALSNQMRDGKAMSPDYAVGWWADQGLLPPDVDPAAFLKKRIGWRYKHGVPNFPSGTVARRATAMRLGDSIGVLGDVRRRIERGEERRFGLLFTSPPYMGVTNYHYDQWLRLWMLGGPSRPEAAGGDHRGKFESRVKYTSLIQDVFGGAAPLLTRTAKLYVRTDAREFTRTTTVDTLRSLFPRKKLTVIERPLSKQSQTALFGDTSKKPGEVDLILS
jgi:hypothetical protein